MVMEHFNKLLKKKRNIFLFSTKNKNTVKNDEKRKQISTLYIYAIYTYNMYIHIYTILLQVLCVSF